MGKAGTGLWRPGQRAKGSPLHVGQTVVQLEDRLSSMPSFAIIPSGAGGGAA
jgi:hypothetical protein